MQALEIQAEVDENRQVHLTLPENWQYDKVKVIVLEDTESIVPEWQKDELDKRLNEHYADPKKNNLSSAEVFTQLRNSIE